MIKKEIAKIPSQKVSESQSPIKIVEPKNNDEKDEENLEPIAEEQTVPKTPKDEDDDD